MRGGSYGYAVGANCVRLWTVETPVPTDTPGIWLYRRGRRLRRPAKLRAIYRRELSEKFVDKIKFLL
jgi:hypothetical protein